MKYHVQSSVVSTPDELEGQFNIPGRGTFNIVHDSSSAQRNEQSSSLRRSPEGLRRRVNSDGNSSAPPSSQGASSSANGGNSSTEQRSPSSVAEELFDEGDLEEPELTTKIRFLDESEIQCRFRPSQSLGDFKRMNKFTGASVNRE